MVGSSDAVCETPLLFQGIPEIPVIEYLPEALRVHATFAV